MATTARNNIVRSPAPDSIFPDAKNVTDSAVSYNQGDLLYFDTSSRTLKPITGDSVGNKSCGVAVVTVVLGIAKSPYQGTAVDAAQAIESIPGPTFGVEATLKLASGDVFHPGDLVYATATDAQTVSVTGANAVGMYVDIQKTGTGSNLGICRIANRFQVAMA